MQLSRQHHQHLLAQPLDDTTTGKFLTSVQASLAEQQRLEATEQGSFEDFVASYYA